jgi:hypothetical protein
MAQLTKFEKFSLRNRISSPLRVDFQVKVPLQGVIAQPDLEPALDVLLQIAPAQWAMPSIGVSPLLGLQS